MKAFLLIERHSVSFYEEKPEIKSVMCAVLAESVHEVAMIAGGVYDAVLLDGEMRPVVSLDRKLFSPWGDSEEIVQYQNGPIHLYIGKDEAGTHLFIIEVPLLQLNEVKV